MEIIKKLLIKFWSLGVLLLIGLFLVIYIALGFVYLQQGAKQEELEKQIVNLSIVLDRVLPSGEELRAKYDEVNLALAPMDTKDAIEKLVSIAKESGIDIDPLTDRFHVPSAKLSQEEMDGGTYQLLSFSDIRMQGDYDDVMAFISDLDSGKTIETMVLRRVLINDVEVEFTGEEGARRAEFRSVIAAVADMMDATALSTIPNPINFAGGVATNLMGDDPNTEGTVEGFPDITTTDAARGYSGNATLRVGYVLYNHDKIDSDNTTLFETVSYINTLTTNYYYTSAADGTVRQFSEANPATATQYLGSEASKTEVIARVSVDIYTKPGE